ncbi:MAG: LysR substrate-binding domain-containing protein, partial [Pseudomonadota bacterium]
QSNEPRKTRLVLSAPHSVAETWLAEKLAPLTKTETYTPIDIRIDDDPVDFVQDKIDMRIFFGHDLYGDYGVTRLFSGMLIAVASPSLIDRFGKRIENIPDEYLIHTDWGRGFASMPNWEAAIPENHQIDRDLGMHVRMSSTALKFARNGFGVALIPAEMGASDLSAGLVQEMEVSPMELLQSYSIACPKRLQSNPTILAVLDNLTR